MTTSKLFCLLGAFFAATAVSLGAFGAHFLKQKISKEMLDVFEVGVRYQLYHALALFAIAWAITHFAHSYVALSGWFIIAGTIIFSGSLYILSLTSSKGFGFFTPIGGLLIILGWILLLIGIWKSPYS